MSADRVRRDATLGTDQTEDLESILRDLEQIIHETLQPAQAEAYVTRLRHLLSELGCNIAPTANALSEPTTCRDEVLSLLPQNPPARRR